jgi:acyl carrier protein
MSLNQTTSSEEKITALLADALQVPLEKVTAELQFGDLPQWDSMGHMEIMLLLEQEYGIEINPDTIADLTSVPVILAYIKGNQHA